VHRSIIIFILLINLGGAVFAQAKGGPAAVNPGKYHCVFFINGALQTTPGFTIQTDGSYLHDSGSKGRYSYDSSQALLVFEGGSLDKQAARVELKEKTAIIRLYNERRSRTVIDCDTPKR
jgi:hypothetical protein